MKEFWRNIICLLFGHSVDENLLKDIYNSIDKKGLVIFCRRCQSYHVANRFALLKEIKLENKKK